MPTAPVSVFAGLARKPLTDAGNRLAQRMSELGAANRSQSERRVRAAYDDSVASQTLVQWGSVTLPATLQASNGRLCGNGGGTAAGINIALPGLVQGGTALVQFTVNIPSSPSGQLIVGISSDSAGGAFTAAAAAIKGLAFAAAASGVQKWDAGSGPSASSNGAAIANGMFQVTMLIDPVWYSIVAVSADGSQEYRARWTRGTVTPNNLSVYNGDSTGTAGRSVGPVSITYGLSSPVTRKSSNQLVVGAQRTVHWTTIPASYNATGTVRIAPPPNYDSRVPSPFVLMGHPYGSDDSFWGDNVNGKLVANALCNAGFIVIGVCGSTTSWGSQLEMDAMTAAYRFVRDSFNLGPGILYTNSMGSIAGLNVLAEGKIPGLFAYIGTSPTYSLLASYDNPGQPFTTAMNAAYSIATGTLSASAAAGATSLSSSVSYPAGTVLLVDYANAGGSNYEQVTVAPAGPAGSGPYALPLTTPLTKAHASGVTISDYPTKTAGHDPALKSGDAFRGVPMLVLAASDDTTVTEALNAAPMIANLGPYAPELLANLANTGGHSFDFTPYVGAGSVYDIVAFAKKYAAA